MLRSHHLLRFYAFVAVLAVSSAVFADSDYRQELTQWRQQHEINLKADNSWLTVAGLFFLNQGKNTFGSGPLNDIVLPTGAPAEAGVLELDGTRVMLRAKEVLTVNGKPAMAAELNPAGVGRPADRVTIGPLSYFVMLSGERIAIRVRDQNSEIRRKFTALKWYAPNEVYRVTGRFEPYPTSKSVKVPNILGDLDTYKASGLVAFTINGQRHRLEAYDVGSGADRGFLIVFRDLTSGRETYPSARFLNAGLPNAKGEVVLDFNKAYNPPCAYNPYTTCPLPTAQNRLLSRIDAGELDYRTTAAR